MAPVIALDELADKDPLWAIWASVGTSCLLVLSGFVLGCVALAQMKRHGRKGVLGRAATGVSLNAGLICLIWACLTAAYNQGAISGTRPTSPSREAELGAGLKEALTRAARMQAAFEKVAQQKSNNLTPLAGPAIEFLQEEQTVLSNYYVTAKPLCQMHLLDTANIESPGDLEKRQTLLLQYIEANKKVSNFCQKIATNFNTMGVKGGLPRSTINRQATQLDEKLNKMNLPAMWQVNDQWARAELHALALLESNWQRWSYDGSLRKTVFHDEDVRNEFNRVVHEINSDERELRQLQQQLQ
jgi:hypothetical protein